MNAYAWRAGRSHSRQSRRPPDYCEVATVAFDGVWDPPEAPTADAPERVWLTATNSRGELAAWFTSAWWYERLRRWGRSAMTVGLAASPGALLHPRVVPVFLQLRERADRWRLAARTDGAPIRGMPSIDRLLRGPWDELAFVVAVGGCRERLLRAMCDVVELRDRRGLDRPEVVWLCRDDAADEAGRLEAQRLARQVRADRFEVLSDVGERTRCG